MTSQSLKQRRSQDLDAVFPALRSQRLGLLRGRRARGVGQPGARRRAAKCPNETLELPVGGNAEPARALAGFDPIGVRYLLRPAQRLAGRCLRRAAADVEPQRSGKDMKDLVLVEMTMQRRRIPELREMLENRELVAAVGPGD